MGRTGNLSLEAGRMVPRAERRPHFTQQKTSLVTKSFRSLVDELL